MNTSHYPSIELCAKLTEIEFPKTEKLLTSFWIYNNNSNLDSIQSEVEYTCPSIMEMLDVIHFEIEFYWEFLQLYIKRVSKENSNLVYKKKAVEIWNFNWPLPNALAEMIIWLHENECITFK